MKEQIKNIVFDVGMVLIDFCWEKHCKNLGFTEDVIEAFRVNMIQSTCWERLDEGTIEMRDAIQQFKDAMPQYQKELQVFWADMKGFVEEYDYALPLIRELQQKNYKVYLLSNYPLEMYRLHWPEFAFFHQVDGYVVSAVEKLAKPNPAIYQLLCNRYGLKAEECVFIDDRFINVEAAKACGMDGIVFEGYESLKMKLLDEGK
ncbi:MAG: HAD family phosphatase [Eubacteriales bacterium]|nr:HAD family phosphatase [Eubacteriales bacterium]